MARGQSLLTRGCPGMCTSAHAHVRDKQPFLRLGVAVMLPSYMPEEMAAMSRDWMSWGLAMMASMSPYSMDSWGDMKKSRSVSLVIVSMDWPENWACARAAPVAHVRGCSNPHVQTDAFSSKSYGRLAAARLAHTEQARKQCVHLSRQRQHGQCVRRSSTCCKTPPR